MAADSIQTVIRRFSASVDTSGAEYPPQPPSLSVVPIFSQRGGVYTQNSGEAGGAENILHGRISLGIIAAFVLGALAFNYWTKEIQGGG
jgi:hypothetical protein